MARERSHGRGAGGTTTGPGDPERRLAEDYERRKAETLRTVAGRLRAQRIDAPEADLDAFYNQAWHALYDRMVAGEEVASVGGFLVEVAYRRAVDDLRRSRRFDREALDDAPVGVEDDVIGRLDDRRRLRELIEGLRSELGERERLAASLCYVHGCSRGEAAEIMGLSRSRMKKVMDDASKVVARLLLEIEEGSRCERRASTTRAYALGLLDPDGERHADARAHLRECSPCRAAVLQLRGLAAVAPAPLLPWGLAVAGGGGAAGAGSVRARPRRPPTSALAASAAAVAAVAVASQALLGGDDAPVRDRAPAPAAFTAAAAGATTLTATPAAPATPASSPSGVAPQRQTRASRRRAPRPAARTRVATDRPSPAPAPLPTAAPVPAPAAAPAAPVPAQPPSPSSTRAPAAPPPIDESGTQEFGIEP